MSKKKAIGWDNLPPGWTDESVEKFWTSLTKSNSKHPVTECIKKMEGKLDDPGAFCASIKDHVEGTTNWRGEKKASTLLSRAIRIAYENPQLRPKLIPAILKKQAKIQKLAGAARLAAFKKALDSQAVQELELFIPNDRGLRRLSGKIEKTLRKQLASGTYSFNKAVDKFRDLALRAAKVYSDNFGVGPAAAMRGGPTEMFPPAVINKVAKSMATDFHDEFVG